MKAEPTIEEVIAHARHLDRELTASAAELQAILIELAMAPEDEALDIEPITDRLQMLAPRLERIGRAGPAIGQDAAAVAASRHRRLSFSEVWLQRTLDKLRERAAANPRSGVALVLHEISAAAEAGQLLAVTRLVNAAAADLGRWNWPVDDVARWAAGDKNAGRRAVEALLAVAAKGSTSDRAPLERLHVVAAVLARDDEDLAAADQYLATALEDWPRSPRLHVERAALLASTSDRRRAIDHARRALDLDPTSGAGELVLGILAETASDYDEARELYASACERLTLDEVSHPSQVATLLRPTGLLHLMRATALATESAWEAARIAAESAIALGVGGAEEYPDLEARQILYDARASERPSNERSRIAMELGMRYLWIGDLDRAVPILTVACEAGAGEPAAGWNLAAAVSSQEENSPQERAIEIWDDWYQQVGPPAREHAWAYPLRGVLAEDGTTDSIWRSIVYCEKALVLNPVSANAWGDLSIGLHRLDLLHLAWAASDAGFAANPDHSAVLAERVALLAMAGRYEDGLAALERVQDQSPAWTAGTKALLLNRLGRPQDSLEVFDSSGGAPPLDMFGAYTRAVSLIDIGLFDSAASELERTISLELSSRNEAFDITFQAEASLLLGRTQEARRYLSDLRDREAFEVDRLLLSVVADFVDGRRESVYKALGRAIRSVRSRHEAMDAVGLLRRCAAMAVARDHPIDDADALIARAALLANARVEVERHDAEESELADAIRRHENDPPDGPARIAVTAIRARRLATDGLLKDAAMVYRMLRETWFEPEATSALDRTVSQRLADAIDAGDANAARESAEQLQSIGHLPYAFVDLPVADALRRAGEVNEASRLLRALRPQADTPDAVFDVERRIGELLMVEGRYPEAASAFSDLLDLRNDDPTTRAQIHVRVALAKAMTFDLVAALSQTEAAVATWRSAGDVHPLRTLVLEVNGLVETLDLGDFTDLVRGLLQGQTQAGAESLATATADDGGDDGERADERD